MRQRSTLSSFPLFTIKIWRNQPGISGTDTHHASFYAGNNGRPPPSDSFRGDLEDWLVEEAQT